MQGLVSGVDGGGYGHVDSAVSWHVSLLVKSLRSEQGSFPNLSVPHVIFLQTQWLSCFFWSVVLFLILHVYQLCAASGFVFLGRVSECRCLHEDWWQLGHAHKNVNRDDWATSISPWMASLLSTLCPTSQRQHLQAINSSKAKSHTTAVCTSFFTAILSTDLKQEVDRSTLHDQSLTHRGTDIHARVMYVLAVSH